MGRPGGRNSDGLFLDYRLQRSFIRLHKALAAEDIQEHCHTPSRTHALQPSNKVEEWTR